MKILKRCWVFLYLLVLLIIAFSKSSNAGGLSAWEDSTPYGSKLYHDGGSEGLVELSVGDSSVWMKEFYFYKKHTIAKADDIFYIINEERGIIEEFNNEADFKKALTATALHPHIFTQWHDENYGFDKFWVPFSLILLPIPFLLPLIWLFCLISFLFESNRMLLARKIMVIGYPLILILVVALYNVPLSF